jgi:hypothetical protein
MIHTACTVSFLVKTISETKGKGLRSLGSEVLVGSRNTKGRIAGIHKYYFSRTPQRHKHRLAGDIKTLRFFVIHACSRLSEAEFKINRTNEDKGRTAPSVPPMRYTYLEEFTSFETKGDMRLFDSKTIYLMPSNVVYHTWI